MLLQYANNSNKNIRYMCGCVVRMSNEERYAHLKKNHCTMESVRADLVHANCVAEMKTKFHPTPSPPILAFATTTANGNNVQTDCL